MSTKTNKIVVLTLVAVMCLSLALLCACQTPAESVTLDKTSATLNVGESITLSATVSPDKAVEHSVLQWSSSNEDVYSVIDNSGTIIGKVNKIFQTHQYQKITVIAKVKFNNNEEITLTKEINRLKADKFNA